MVGAAGDADHPSARAATLAELRAVLAPCRLCLARGLHVESLPVVSGSREAEAMLVGQAPGTQEALTRRPFSGPAGRRLRAWLAPAGLGDEDAFYRRLYIAAVVKCFPGKRPGGGDRRPSRAIVATCSPWLRRELELVPARVVIAVGTLALEELLPGVRLDEAVGRRFELADGRAVVPLPHPSGANPWPHLRDNAGKLARAVALVATELDAGRAGPTAR